MVKNLPANTGATRDKGSTFGLGRASGVGNGHPLQYSCLENSMDRGVWWAAVHWVTKSQIRLSTHGHTHTHTHKYLSKSQYFKSLLPQILESYEDEKGFFFNVHK